MEHLENQSALEASDIILKPTQNMSWDKGLSGHCSLRSEYFTLFCSKFFLNSLMALGISLNSVDGDHGDGSLMRGQSKIPTLLLVVLTFLANHALPD